MIIYLQNMGIADVLLPFLLIFVIAYAILQKSRILGDVEHKPEVKRFNLIVALVMGMAVVVPHVVWGDMNPNNPYLITGQIDPVKMINNSLPSVSVVLVGILMVMLLLGLFGTEFDLAGQTNVAIILFSLVTVGYIFLTNAGYFNNGLFPTWLWFLADPNTQSLLIVVLVFGIIVWYITKDENKNKEAFIKWDKFIKPMGGGGGGGGHH